MGWEIEFAPEAEAWYRSLPAEAKTAMKGAIDLLATRGPTLGRPAVDRIHGSRLHNMKELRAFGGNQRALVVFDSNRHAIVLAGGDKSGDWAGWYARTIPIAEARYARHLREIGKGGACRAAAGARSTERTR